MFTKPTTIILGAGASFECGLPLGAALRDSIADALDFSFDFGQIVSGDRALFELLRGHYPAGELNKIAQAARTLSGAAKNFPSMDEALHYFGNQPQIVELGKLAIVSKIIAAENISRLAVDRQTGRVDTSRLRGTWYDLLFSIAIAGLRKENIVEIFANTTFINFNYDRTLECFLFHNLVDAAGISTEQAADIVTKMRILRPYGSLGALDLKGAAQIGGQFSSKLFAMGKGIRTFTEAHQQNLQRQVTEELDRAKLVIILGFGFHSQNMALLETGFPARRAISAVFATAKDIHSQNLDTIERALKRNLVANQLKLLDMTASQLLGDLRPSIVDAAR